MVFACGFLLNYLLMHTVRIFLIFSCCPNASYFTAHNFSDRSSNPFYSVIRNYVPHFYFTYNSPVDCSCGTHDLIAYCFDVHG